MPLFLHRKHISRNTVDLPRPATSSFVRVTQSNHSHLCHITVKDFHLLVSRTGYGQLICKSGLRPEPMQTLPRLVGEDAVAHVHAGAALLRIRFTERHCEYMTA